MAKSALVERRPWLLVSLIAALAYYFLSNNPIGELWLILIKGAAVGCLAGYAMRRAFKIDGAILALSLALASAADMALELDFETGGALFAASHVVAIALYIRNLRPHTPWSQRLAALGLVIATPFVSFLLSGRADIALYAATLGLMAACAWMSRFPRYRVGIGAVLFVVSDWLIFSRFGPIDLAPAPDWLVWPLYYAGQFMIATGVVQTLRGEVPAK